jgi:DNA repair protein RadC
MENQNSSLPTQNSCLKVAEIKLTYSNDSLLKRIAIKEPTTAYEVLKSHWSEQMSLVEEFNILLLDRANRVLGFQNISKGGFSATMVDLKVIFASALVAKASGLILAHNHPSQQLRPSNQDIELTNRIKDAAQLLEITVLDHIIMTSQNGYYSFLEHGKL